MTSVCTGSLVLGAAGLLNGYKSACHWASRDLLSAFGAIPVAERVVRDRNRLSGGGVTAGIDFGLTLLAELAGEEVAQSVQLGSNTIRSRRSSRAVRRRPARNALPGCAPRWRR